MINPGTVNTNLAALQNFLTLKSINKQLSTVQSEIASGFVINQVSDSPSGYYISKVLERDAASQARLASNAERSKSFLEGNSSKLDTAGDILLEMSDLALQAEAASTDDEKQVLQSDLEGLRIELDSILSDGLSSEIYDSLDLGTLTVNIEGSGAGGGISTLSSLTLDGSNMDVTTSSASIDATQANIDAAISQLASENSQIGTSIKRLNVQIDDFEQTELNILSTLSSVRDADLLQKNIQLQALTLQQQSSLSMFAASSLFFKPMIDTFF